MSEGGKLYSKQRFMRKNLFLFVCSFFMFCAASSRLRLQAAPVQQISPASGSQQRVLLDKYCVTCHNQRSKTAGLSLDTTDLAKVPDAPKTGENVIRKVKGGIMPPVGMPRPEKAELDALASYLETTIDRAAADKPNPGRKVLHRLNRAEYGNAIRDLFALDLDITSYLPADYEAHGFDNIADVLGLSPALMERYLSAAWKITDLAIGSTKITPSLETFRVRSDLSQNDHIEGLPIGTRGGILIHYNFPVDGEYVIRPKLYRETVNIVRGLEVAHDLEITFDGDRVQLTRFGGAEDEQLAYLHPTSGGDEIEKRFEKRLAVKAGPHSVGVAFLKKSSAPTLELLEPFQRERIDPITPVGIPEIDKATIEGPFNVLGPGDSPSRRRIFTCRPAGDSDALSCAKRILSTIARRAYRRPMTDTETGRLVEFYQKGRDKGGSFDAGIQQALVFMLVSPQFLFRFELDPANAGPIYRISDLELASRLSFFIWSSIPDDQLLDLAIQGKLKNPAILEQQRKNSACSGCHKLMDPIGLSLENFDGIGRWRAADGGTRIDASDTLFDGTKVDGPVALRRAVLGRSDQFVRTMTEMLLTYGLGRGIEYYDMPVVRSILKESARNNYRFSSLVLGIVKSAPFQMKVKRLQDSENNN